MPQNLDSGAKIGLATFVATSVGFGPQRGRRGGGIRTHDRWDPRAASPTIRPRGVFSPGESSPRGIILLGDTPLGNRLPGESSPWERPPWGIVSQGNRSPGRDPLGESSPRGIIPLGETPLGNRLPGESFPWERPPWGIVPQGNHSPGRHPSSAQGFRTRGPRFRTRLPHKGFAQGSAQGSGDPSFN